MAVFSAIVRERDHQNAKFGWLENPHSDLPNGSWDRRLAVITEELGEVAKAINDGDIYGAIHELVEVAACAVAVLEAIITRDEELEAALSRPNPMQ